MRRLRIPPTGGVLGRLRLPPYATIIRPMPEESGEESLIDGDVPLPPRRTVASIDTRPKPPAPSKPPGGFVAAFAALAETDVRTKPSYTDCWVAGVPELRPIASYMTDMGSVMIGLSDGGETMYCVTPREYAYPDGLNAVVMDVIEEIRDAYREEGGSLDRDAVMGMTRSVLAERWGELEEAAGAGADAVMRDVCSIAYRHSVGAGVFEVLLADTHIEDVYVDAPCSANRIHVTVNGINGLNSHIRCSTNLMAEEREVDNLLNILKRQSGLRFCRSSPVLETDMRGFDARATVVGYPLSPRGNAVAIRKHSVRPWTLSRLIANGTVSPRAAGILSFIVNSRATILVCGARGAGKSSLLSALMFEFPLSQRVLTIEDTLELPGDCMRGLGYKVQTMLVDERIQGNAFSRSDEALRVSLRLGESAIVMGEVRGEEAKTLYQSMRAGRAGSAIMGTVHGDSAESVYKRMIYDMGIPAEEFGATDILVTLGTVRDRRTGNLIRRVNELVATGTEPGAFTDASGTDGLLSTPFAERALGALQMSRREAVKDIRARSMMRSHLASLGTRDEGFLGPEWILTANEILASVGPGATAEDALAELKRRTGDEARPQASDERGPDGGRAHNVGHRVRRVHRRGRPHGGRGGPSDLQGAVRGGGAQGGHQGCEERNRGSVVRTVRSAGVRSGLPPGRSALRLRRRVRRRPRKAQDTDGGVGRRPGRGEDNGRALRRGALDPVHDGVRPGDNGADDPDVHPADDEHRHRLRLDAFGQRHDTRGDPVPDPGGHPCAVLLDTHVQPVPERVPGPGGASMRSAAHPGGAAVLRDVVAGPGAGGGPAVLGGTVCRRMRDAAVRRQAQGRRPEEVGERSEGLRVRAWELAARGRELREGCRGDHIRQAGVPRRGNGVEQGAGPVQGRRRIRHIPRRVARVAGGVPHAVRHPPLLRQGHGGRGQARHSRRQAVPELGERPQGA